MSPDQQPQKQAGAGLPIALFIVTVLSLIVLGMSQLQESSGNAISLQIQSQRAFFAAESGAQVVVAHLLRREEQESVSLNEIDDLECFDDPETPDRPIFDKPYNVSGLQSCSARAYCKSDDRLFEIKSIGSCGAEGAPDHAQRTVEVRLSVD